MNLNIKDGESHKAADYYNAWYEQEFIYRQKCVDDI